MNNVIAFASLATLQLLQRPHARFSSTKELHPVLCDDRNSVRTRNYLSSLFAASPDIEISQVQSNADILSLADLRYQEWILEDNNQQNDTAAPTERPRTSPSRTSFRFATADIYQKRRAEGARVFLAKYCNIDHRGVDERNAFAVVGAAELSPIELRGCIQNNGVRDIENLSMAMYATDVVISRSHRRLGIGSKLMSTMEDTARSLNCRFVFLHVEHDNVAAIDFYHRLGYLDVIANNKVEDVEGVVALSMTSQGLSILPVDTNPTRFTESESTHGFAGKRENGIAALIVSTRQLAINAGTVGQLLMVKPLFDKSRSHDILDKNVATSNSISKPAVSTGVDGRAGGFAKLKQRNRTKK